jgi:DMSO/TMAO reductase YedYZ molybdopterin-dependent catalytic subunit
MKPKTAVLLVVLVAVVAGAAFLVNDYARKNPKPDTVSQATESRYQENEIREYKGAILDPAIGPRDNSIKGIQTIDIGTYRLKITGLVDDAVSLTYQQVTDLPSITKKITLYCVEGWEATVLWEGASLEDLMNLAGVKPEANTVIFHAADGYTTSLPLETIRDRELILGYMANGLPLPAELGYPFIVVAEDKLGYKWARWVTEIELSDDPGYLGYWERRGYNNDAEVGPRANP